CRFYMHREAPLAQLSRPNAQTRTRLTAVARSSNDSLLNIALDPTEASGKFQLSTRSMVDWTMQKTVLALAVLAIWSVFAGRPLPQHWELRTLARGLQERSRRPGHFAAGYCRRSPEHDVRPSDHPPRPRPGRFQSNVSAILGPHGRWRSNSNRTRQDKATRGF